MKTNKSTALITSLQAQMQWVAGQPQVAANASSRLLYDFNNDENILERKIGEFPGVTSEVLVSAQQESTICDPETGDLVLFFTGENIYDGFKNKVNATQIDTLTGTRLTSIIAPNLSRENISYNVFYVDKTTRHLSYAMVDFRDGLDNPATWIGTQTLDSTSVASPFGLACVNESLYWVLALANAHTLIAYRFDVTGEDYPVLRVALEPFSFLGSVEVNCTLSSIVSFGEKIAITVNGNLMMGEMIFSGAGFSIINQVMVDTTTSSLMPAFNKTKTKLFYLKTASPATKNHVYAYEIEPGASYSVDASYIYNNVYKTLKLAPNGKVYGTNTFAPVHVDPVLVLEDISASNTTVVSELISENKYSSDTFGNIQYEINNLPTTKTRYM